MLISLPEHCSLKRWVSLFPPFSYLCTWISKIKTLLTWNVTWGESDRQAWCYTRLSQVWPENLSLVCSALLESKTYGALEDCFLVDITLFWNLAWLSQIKLCFLFLSAKNPCCILCACPFPPPAIFGPMTGLAHLIRGSLRPSRLLASSPTAGATSSTSAWKIYYLLFLFPYITL